MKKWLFVFLLLPLLAWSATYEDLEQAMIRKDSPAAIALLQRGVDVNTVDRSGDTLLVQAMRQDMRELIDYLLQHRARVNIRNRNGETALSIAAYNGNLDYVKRLVAAGGEVNFYGWAPLAYAAYNGHTEVVAYLLDNGAEVDAKTSTGATALFFAARFAHLEVVKLLLAHDADPNILNEHDESAVDWAIKGKNTDIEALLREAGGRSGKSVVIDFSK